MGDDWSWLFSCSDVVAVCSFATLVVVTVVVSTEESMTIPMLAATVLVTVGRGRIADSKVVKDSILTGAEIGFAFSFFSTGVIDSVVISRAVVEIEVEVRS